ncbi:sensor histidine kinase [Salininema proteolyticum]|uniref:histidine kinase n=1 Tax=Salininema proteolyticum TaxID=1607685 RepID=A0ABV8TVI6_9ACTN
MTTREHALRYSDAAVAGLGVLVCVVMGLLGQPDWWWSTAMAATLVLRRPAPLLCALAAAAISTVHLVLTTSLLMPGDLVLLVAAYSVAAHASSRTRQIGLLLWTGYVVVLGGRILLGETETVTGANLFVVGLVAAGLLTASSVGFVSHRKTDALRVAEFRRMLSEQEADARAQLATYEERERISNDIHDILAHTLTGVVVQAESGRATAPTEDVADLFTGIASSSRSALYEVRSLLTWTGEPGTHPTPSLDDLDELIESFTRSDLRVDIERSGQPVPLGPGMSLAVYRVVQESLTNALRHGDGSEAKVLMDWEPDALTLTVSNPMDGASRRLPIRENRGLAGIRRRCALYNGEAFYESADVFTVVAKWPLTIQKDVNRA